jgi:hypothetical protein
MASISSTPPPPASTTLLPPFSSDFGPRPLPQAVRKPYADLGSSSIRSASYNHRISLTNPPAIPSMMSTPTPIPTSGIKVVNSSLQPSYTGFSVQRRSNSFLGPSGSSSSAIAGPGPSTRSASYTQDSSTTRRRMYYAVAAGHKKGIYETWAEAEEQIKVSLTKSNSNDQLAHQAYSRFLTCITGSPCSSMEDVQDQTRRRILHPQCRTVRDHCS